MSGAIAGLKHAPPATTWLGLGLGIIFLGLLLPHWASDPGWRPVLGFLGTLAGTLCLFVSFGLAITDTHLGILRGGNNTFSLARLQMAAWTWLILSALIGIAVARLWNQAHQASNALNIYIPSNLFIVMGISYFTGAAAPALLSLKSATPNTPSQVETARTRMNETGVAANGQVIVRSLAHPPRLGDLVEGDDVATAGTVDISKVQQLLITALLLGVYFCMLWDLFTSPEQIWNMPGDVGKALTQSKDMVCGLSQKMIDTGHYCGQGWAAMPDFPKSLVTLLAVSHGGYLAYKAAPRAAANNDGSAAAKAGDASKAVG